MVYDGNKFKDLILGTQGFYSQGPETKCELVIWAILPALHCEICPRQFRVVDDDGVECVIFKLNNEGKWVLKKSLPLAIGESMSK